MTTLLLPRKIREFTDQLSVEQADLDTDLAALKALKGRTTLTDDERSHLADLQDRVGRSIVLKDGTDLSTGRHARIAELTGAIKAELAEQAKAENVAKRAAAQSTIQDIHARAVARHDECAQQLQAWADASVALVSKRFKEFEADSLAIESAVQCLATSDPQQCHRWLSHVVDILRGTDHNFSTALSHALGQILQASLTGAVMPPSQMGSKLGGNPTFAKAAWHAVTVLNARLPEMYAAAVPLEPASIPVLRVSITQKG